MNWRYFIPSNDTLQCALYILSWFKFDEHHAQNILSYVSLWRIVLFNTSNTLVVCPLSCSRDNEDEDVLQRFRREVAPSFTSWTRYTYHHWGRMRRHDSRRWHLELSDTSDVKARSQMRLTIDYGIWIGTRSSVIREFLASFFSDACITWNV